MESDDVTFQWMEWQDDAEVKFGISLNFDEFNNGMEVTDIVDKSLAEEKNRCLNTFPSTRSHALKFDDIIEAVNLQTDIEETQRELRTALSVKSRVSRSGNLNVSDDSAECYPEEPRV